MDLSPNGEAMSPSDPSDLVLARLRACGGTGEGSRGVAFTRLVERGDDSPEQLSEQIAVASAVERLREDGLVAAVDEAGDDAETRFTLTDRGTEKAQEVTNRIRETEITVADADHREVTVATAAAELDRSPVEVYAALSADGVYYPPGETATDGVVDREAERDRCRSVVETVRDERSGRAVFLAGPAGVGKTALLDAVLADAEDRGLDVVGARCRGSDDPYQPLRTCLAALEGEAPFEGALPDVDDPEVYEAQQSALFHELTAALAPDPDEPARVLWFEDLQLTDAGTAAYLAAPLERLADQPLVVVGTYRPTELPDVLATAVGEGVETEGDGTADADGDGTEAAGDEGEGDEDTEEGAADDGADGPVTRVELGPFSAAETRRLVEQVVGERGAPTTLVEAVHERTGGNPLFVRETVERLLERGDLGPRYEWYPEEPGDVAAPDAVAETVIERVDALTDPATSVLRWAALVGQYVPLDVLAAVCDVPEALLDRLVGALVEADVFEWADSREGVTFRNTAVRRALEDDVGDEERRRRHAAIAAAFVERMAAADAGMAGERADDERPDDVRAGESDSSTGSVGDIAATVAAHYERAGEDRQAIEWYRRAGEYARGLYAHEAAIEQFHAALALARESDDDETTLDIAERLADVYLTTGDHDEAERFAEFARERAEDPGRRQRAAAQACEVANARGDFEAAVEMAESALALSADPSRERVRLFAQTAKAEGFLGEYGSARATTLRQLSAAARAGATDLEAVATLSLGTLAWRQDDYEAARKHLDSALALAESVGDRQTAGRARMNLGVVAWNRGEYERALAAYRAAGEDFEAVGDRHRTAMVHNNIGDVRFEQGAYDDAETAYRRALEGFEAAGNRRAVGIARMNLGKTAVRRGDYDAAKSSLTEALERLDAVGVAHAAAVTGLHLGRVGIHRAEYDRARELLTEAREGFESVEDRHRVASADLRLGELALAEGDHEAAGSRLGDALEAFRTVGAEQDVAEAKLALGRLRTETGDHAAARDRLGAALEAFERADNRHEVARTHLQLGRVGLAESSYEAARDHFETALETLEAIEASHCTAETRRALGELAAERGDGERAVGHLRAAADAFEEIGAVGDALDTLAQVAETCEEADERAAFRERAERLGDRVSERALARHGWSDESES
jgi:predicted ATPase